MKKLFNLCSLFLGVIGLCAATLICHIVFIYPNINKSSSTDNNAIIAQTSTTTINTQQEENPFSVETFANQTHDTDLDMNSQTASDNPDIPDEYQSALNKANDYSNTMYMSKAAIYNQLTSEYGEHFSPEAAQYAIDNIVANWNSNALQKAKDYSDNMYMSQAAIYDQLISDYGEKFTPAEAQYAVENLITDYNSNALQKAIDYQNMNMSPEAIRNQLTSEYGERFTPDQASYAVANLSSGNNPVQNTITQNNSEYNANANNEPEIQVSTPVGDMVWLSATGEKYHSINNCGRMNPDKARQVSLEDAISMGYEECSKCYY